MINNQSTLQLNLRPLCVAYDVLQFQALSVEICSADSTYASAVHWALGTHESGCTEVIGTWLAAHDSTLDPLCVSADFLERGLIHFACLVEERTAVRTARPEAGATSVPNQRLSRHRLLSASRTSQLAQAIRQAVRRQPPFQSETEALTFVSQSLERLERRMCSVASAKNCQAAQPRRKRLVASQRRAAGLLSAVRCD